MPHTDLSSLFAVVLMPLKTRLFSVLLAASLPVVAFAPEASAATPTQVEAQQRVQIELSFTSADGSALEASAVGDFGAQTRLSLTSESHRHDIRVTVTRPSEGDAFGVKFSYRRDGKTVIKTKRIEAGAGGTARLQTPDGRTMLLQLGFAKPKRAPLDLPEGDDPLAGV